MAAAKDRLGNRFGGCGHRHEPRRNNNDRLGGRLTTLFFDGRRETILAAAKALAAADTDVAAAKSVLCAAAPTLLAAAETILAAAKDRLGNRFGG